MRLEGWIADPVMRDMIVFCAELVAWVVVQIAWAWWLLVRLDRWWDRREPVELAAQRRDQRAAYVFAVVREGLGAKDDARTDPLPVAAKDADRAAQRRRAESGTIGRGSDKSPFC